MPRLHSRWRRRVSYFQAGHAVVSETALGAVGLVVGDQVLKRVEQVLRGKAKSQVAVKFDGDFVATA